MFGYVMYSPSGQIPMHELQRLHVLHAGSDLRRDVDQRTVAGKQRN